MLGKRLRTLRGEKTQQEIAEKLGVSRARYSHYENDRVQPDTELLRKMAELHDVTIDYLLERSSEEISLNKIKSDLDEATEETIEEFLKLSEEDQQYVKDLIRRIRKT